MLNKLVIRSLKATFDESEHPRAEDGKFDETGGGGGGDEGEGQPIDNEATDTPEPDWTGKKKRKSGEVNGYYDYAHMPDAKADARSAEMSVKQMDGLEQKHWEAANEYTGQGYKEINGGLRGQGKLSAGHKKVVKQMDDALGKSALPENTVLYRGMSLSPDKLASLKPGAKLHDAAYTSTSLSQAKSEQYANKGAGDVIMRIKAPKGTRAMAVEDVSNFRSEKEVILPRNTSFKITKVTKDKKGRTYVEAEIVQG